MKYTVTMRQIEISIIDVDEEQYVYLSKDSLIALANHMKQLMEKIK